MDPKDSRDCRDLRETKVFQGFQVQRDYPAQTKTVDLLVIQEILVLLVFLAKMETLVARVSLVLPDHLVPPATVVI